MSKDIFMPFKAQLNKRSAHFAFWAMLVFLFQATFPFFLANCPLLTSSAPVTISVAQQSAMMMPDCPMMMDDQAPSHEPDHTDHNKHTNTICPLCAVLIPAHAALIAELIAFPLPKPSYNDVETTQFVSLIISRPITASFSARAPPFFI